MVDFHYPKNAKSLQKWPWLCYFVFPIDCKRFYLDPTNSLGIKPLGASVLVYRRVRICPQIQKSVTKNPWRIGPNGMKIGHRVALISFFTRANSQQAAMNTSRDMNESLLVLLFK